MNFIRAAVSGKRNRYRDDGFDLDLSYITPRIMAMGFPASGFEGAYRNHIDDVGRFLRSRHGESFMIFNLSERHYDPAQFGHRVLELGFPDHHAPPVEVAWAVCRTMDAWLTAAPENVAVVHCLAGKGRTGVIIACYLLFSGHLFQRYLRESISIGMGGGATGGGSQGTAHTSVKGHGSSSSGMLRDGDELARYEVAVLPHSFGGPAPPSAPHSQSQSGAAQLESSAHPSAAGAGRPATAPAASASASPGSPGKAALAPAVASRIMGLAAVAERAAAGAAERAAAVAQRAVAAAGGSRASAPPAPPYLQPDPSRTISGSGRAALDAMASAADSAMSRAAHFPLPPPSEMARQVLLLFRSRRGEGVKYPSQERIVRYFARVVHDALLGEHFVLQRADAEEAAAIAAARAGAAAELPVISLPGVEPPARRRAGSTSGLARPISEEVRLAQLQAMMQLLMAPSEPVALQGSQQQQQQHSHGHDTSHASSSLADYNAKTVLVRTSALRELRRLKQLPLPRRVPVLLTKVVLRGVPNVPGGFVPLLHVCTAPYQGATTRVIYSSAWTNPVPTAFPPAPAAGPGAGAVGFVMAAHITGDILVTCTALAAAGAGGGSSAAGGGGQSGGSAPAAAASVVGGNASLSSSPSSAALLRLSFHTAFMITESASASSTMGPAAQSSGISAAGSRAGSGPLSGAVTASGGGAGSSGSKPVACVYRLSLADLDVEHRKKNEPMFPKGFAVELHFSYDAAAAAAAAGGMPDGAAAAAVGERQRSFAGKPAAAGTEAATSASCPGSAAGSPIPSMFAGLGREASVSSLGPAAAGGVATSAAAASAAAVDSLTASLAGTSIGSLSSSVLLGGGAGASSLPAGGYIGDADFAGCLTDGDDDDSVCTPFGLPSSSPAPHALSGGSGTPQRTVGFSVKPGTSVPVPVLLVGDEEDGRGGNGRSGGGLTGTGELDISASAAAGSTDVVAMGNLAKAGGVMGTSWRRRFCVLRRLPVPGGAAAATGGNGGEEGDAPPSGLAAAIAGASSGPGSASASSSAGFGTGSSSDSSASPLQVTGSAALQVPLGHLCYFASSRDPAPRGIVPISLASLRRTRVTWPPGHPAAAVMAAALAAEGADQEDHDEGSAPIDVGTAGSRDRPFTLALRARGRRYFFQAEGEADLRTWLHAFAALVPQGLDVPPQLRV